MKKTADGRWQCEKCNEIMNEPFHCATHESNCEARLKLVDHDFDGLMSAHVETTFEKTFVKEK